MRKEKETVTQVNHLQKAQDNLTNNNEHLSEIIKIQSLLTEADLDLNQFINLITEKMHGLTPATGTVVELKDGDDMIYHAATGSATSFLGLRLKSKDSLSGLCVREKKILRCDDTETDSRVNLEACRKVNARSMVVAPLFYGEQAVGVLKILSSNPNGFSENDVQTLELMAGFIGAAIGRQMRYEINQQLLLERTSALESLEKKLLKHHEIEKKLITLTQTDSLTKLSNRSLLYSKLRSILTGHHDNHALTALIYLDIDHFKTINDTKGHDVGDTLLKAFALRLKSSVRSSDSVIARIGGDEFVILIEKIKNKNELDNIIKHIMSRIRGEYQIGEENLKITVSMGAVLYLMGNLTMEEFIKKADQALYQIKNAGRDGYKIVVAPS